MASISFPPALFIAITLFLTLKITTAATEMNEKEIQFHFYGNGRIKYSNATIITTVPSPFGQSNQLFNFGDILVFDNPLTEGYDPTSRLIGRVQGTLTIASLDSSACILTTNWFFTDFHPWTGSSITVVGRLPFPEETSELQVVGGTGQFRNARGYLLYTKLSSQDVNLKLVDVKVVVAVKGG